MTSADDVYEYGAVVEDREDTSESPDRAVVVNLPPVPADEWEAYDGTTVAEDNPTYNTQADVIVVAFRDALEETHPDWGGDAPLTLPLECHTYAFPAERLRRVGHLHATDTPSDDTDDHSDTDPGSDSDSAPPNETATNDHTGGDTTGDQDTDESQLTEAQHQLYDRLAETAEVSLEADEGATVLVVEKLGVEHRISPDGSVDEGPLADRLAEVASNYLGDETA